MHKIIKIGCKDFDRLHLEMLCFKFFFFFCGEGGSGENGGPCI